jgi:hypothetical protein
MSSRSKPILARASRLGQDVGPLLIVIENNPEPRRLGIPMASNREATLGGDHYQALDSESTKTFHARLRAIARERGARMVILGHESNIEPLQEARFDREGLPLSDQVDEAERPAKEGGNEPLL